MSNIQPERPLVRLTTPGNLLQWAKRLIDDIFIRLQPVNDEVVFLFHGTGSPEGVVNANPGSIYFNTSGGVGTSFYIKETGTGNTGWAVPSGGGGTSDFTVQETDGTGTGATTVFTIPTAADTVYLIQANILARQTAGSTGSSVGDYTDGTITIQASNIAGILSVDGISQGPAILDAAGNLALSYSTSAGAYISGTNIIFKAHDSNGNTIHYVSYLLIQKNPR